MPNLNLYNLRWLVLHSSNEYETLELTIELCECNSVLIVLNIFVKELYVNLLLTFKMPNLK